MRQRTMTTQKFLNITWMLVAIFQACVSIAADEIKTVEITTLLPIQDVNILILTDVHSWVNGHSLREPALDIDYGDILSFYQQLKQQLSNEEKDLWLVMNGNFVHGSVLGQDPPIALAGILEQMPYDLVTLGNHELESSETIRFMKRPGGLFDWWGSKLIISNTPDSTKQRTGYPYKHLKGTAANILAFSFLYDTNFDESSDLITLEGVEKTIELPWFQAVLDEGNFDMILILSYVDVRDEIVQIILKKIRSICQDDMLVQFVTGQTHIRDYTKLDSHASSVEAGHYLDTLGFVSVDMSKKELSHTFIDANKKSLSKAIGMKKYTTSDGEQLSKFILRAVENSGGNEILGCSPKRFRAEGLLTEEDSLLRLYLKSILPQALTPKSVLLQNIEYFARYDLFPGIITMDDIWSIVPRNDNIHKIVDSLKGDTINHLEELLSGGATFLNLTASTYNHNLNIEIKPGGKYQLFALSSELSKMKKILGTDMKVHPIIDEFVADEEGPMTMHKIWIDFITQQWPYDEKQCEIVDHNTSNEQNIEEVDNELINTPSAATEETFPKDQIIQEDHTIQKGQTIQEDHLIQKGQTIQEDHMIQKDKTNKRSPFGAFVAFSIVIGTLYVMARPFMENRKQQNHPFVERRTRGEVAVANDLEMKPMSSRSRGYQDIPNSYQSGTLSA